MNIPSSFFILVGIIYLYFIIQYFFTQWFYSKNMILSFAILSLSIPVILYFISEKAHKIEAPLEGLGIFYYLLILLVIKLFYKKANTFLVKRKRLNEKFAGKDFTYVTYNKGIFYRGHSWNEALASAPSWLDHTLSVILILLPFIIVIVSMNIGLQKIFIFNSL